MKQYITIEQLEDLSDKAKEELRDWWKPDTTAPGIYYSPAAYYSKELKCFSITNTGGWRKYYERFRHKSEDGYIEDINSVNIETCPAYPLLSIGQMIEFVNDSILSSRWDSWIVKTYARSYIRLPSKQQDEICDALWSAVKSILEGE